MRKNAPNRQITLFVLGALSFFFASSPLMAESLYSHSVQVDVSEARATSAAPDVYEIEVDVVKVQPRLVRQQVFQPERVCREEVSPRSYRNQSQRYHNPNHRGHSDACDDYRYGRRADLDRVRTSYRCYIVERERLVERIDGYEVTYLYNGQELTKRLDYDPGRRLRIRVQAQPQVSGSDRSLAADPAQRPLLTL